MVLAQQCIDVLLVKNCGSAKLHSLVITLGAYLGPDSCEMLKIGFLDIYNQVTFLKTLRSGGELSPLKQERKPSGSRVANQWQEQNSFQGLQPMGSSEDW